MSDAIKFPKTPRFAQAVDLYNGWSKHTAVVEEKIDGANVGIWFDHDDLQLQSRGHVLQGGGAEKQFAAFHGWAAERLPSLLETLSYKYVLYGEWCFAKHKAFYDNLPDWLIGYDVLDRSTEQFLTTKARDSILTACRVCIVPCLWRGQLRKAPAFASLIDPSKFKTSTWRDRLAQEAAKAKVKDFMAETDDSDLMEGVYIRVEDANYVVGRMKLHREGYTKVRSDHWRQRPLIRNVIRSHA